MPDVRPCRDIINSGIVSGTNGGKIWFTRAAVLESPKLKL